MSIIRQIATDALATHRAAEQERLEAEVRRHEAQRATERTAAMDMVTASKLATWFPGVEWSLRYSCGKEFAVVRCDEEPDLLFVVDGVGSSAPVISVTAANPTASARPDFIRGAISLFNARDLIGALQSPRLRHARPKASA